jgi:hypothetical protein
MIIFDPYCIIFYLRLYETITKSNQVLPYSNFKKSTSCISTFKGPGIVDFFYFYRSMVIIGSQKVIYQSK